MKTKSKCIFAIIFVATIGMSNCYAQDIIITKESRKIETKILEIDLEVVRYKNYSNQNGPTYVIKKSDIASIVYANGDVEVFNKPEPEKQEQIKSVISVSEEEAPVAIDSEYPIITDTLKYKKGYAYMGEKKMDGKQLKIMYTNNQEAMSAFKASKRLEITYAIFAALSSVPFGFAFASLCYLDWDAMLNYAAVGAGVILFAKMFDIASNKKLRQSINFYNSSKKTTTASLHLGLTNSGGFGIVLNF